MVPAWADPAQRNRNNFDFLRLLFSVAVIFSHSFDMLAGKGGVDPLGQLSDVLYTFGGLAVCGFFTISGYLIAGSLVRSPGFFDYLGRRMRRIYPGFLMAVALTLVVGYFINAYRVPEGEFRSESVRAVISTLTLTWYEPPFAFAANPLHTFNGSLWTIRPEFTCYLLLALVFQVRRTRHRMMMLAILPFILWAFETACMSSGQPLLMALRPFIPAPGNPGWPPRLWCCFALGAGMHIYGHRIPYRNSLASLAVGLMVVLGFTPAPKLSGLVSIIPFGYLVFWFGYHPIVRLHDFGRFGDYSYGIYLYGFPVEQTLILLIGASLNPYTLTLLALAVLLPVAVLSWFLVERPCLAASRKYRDNAIGQKPVPDKSKKMTGVTSNV
ncbi:MAG: acyltransferase [Chthoniobacteraceae bacterium]|nr:acyltransferase [Chthoniobacteraceae bacterium]